jgi:hypothetical protein
MRVFVFRMMQTSATSELMFVITNPEEVSACRRRCVLADHLLHLKQGFTRAFHVFLRNVQQSSALLKVVFHGKVVSRLAGVPWIIAQRRGPTSLSAAYERRHCKGATRTAFVPR